MRVMRRKKELHLILDNVRSAHNVGSIFRTADAAGVSKIYLIGVTPTPTDRFGHFRKDIAKVALGAEKSVSWEYCRSLLPLFRKLKKEGFYILALEQDKTAVDYKKVSLKVSLTPRAALIVGSEVSGIKKGALRMCDCVCEIPMRGKKESLNVAVALGIALFRLLRI